jgi:hypothetical protein
MTDPEMEEAVLKAYAMVGHCATGFAALEFHAQFLLSILLMGREKRVSRSDSGSQRSNIRLAFAAGSNGSARLGPIGKWIVVDPTHGFADDG